MGFRVLLSVMVLTSCFMVNVFGGDDLDLVSWTQAPHHAPSYPPVGAPPPHHHHKGPGGHHHKPAVPPTAHPPTVAPVHPPIKTPVAPPTKAPVAPPTKAPVAPPTKAPVAPPTKAPVKPPTKAPVKPPTKAPVHPPIHSPAPKHAPLPTRRQVAVRGVVYCKACKYKGVDTLMAATPLQGAVVLLTCNNTKYPLRVKATTDKNGFFFIMPPKTLTTYGAHTCRVTLLSSPKATCNQPTNLHYGLKGATLVLTPKPHGSSLPAAPPLPFDVFTVGPFAFEASKKTPCTH
ncbi:non-classical arabinogalactan protein 30 [Cynara cardunculus var. scolymus]|uniref:non-classical arabinogalactan protein 30 n=1 Tax=Cynara cardunculus var. scolymus TaxID=59895 RepID=UPI000D62A5AA|nr:non-classical arabinogalactan protein 30 [Cynara cardunculus var. scolymus]